MANVHRFHFKADGVKGELIEHIITTTHVKFLEKLSGK